MRKNFITFIICILLFPLYAYNESTSNYSGYNIDYGKIQILQLRKIYPTMLFFIGTVHPVSSVLLSFRTDGKIFFLRNQGDYIHSPLYDMKSKKYIGGTIVGAFKTDLALNRKEKATVMMNIAENNLKYKIEEENRSRILFSKKAISEKLYNQAKETQLESMMKYEMSKLEYKDALFELESCFLKSPISGIITKVYKTIGEIGKASEKVMEITDISTVYIKIKIPGEIVQELKESKTAYVYPLYSNKIIKGKTQFNEIDREHIYIYMQNPYDLEASCPNILNEEVADVFTIFQICKMEEMDNSSSLAIPLKAVHYDEKSFFVYKVIDYQISENKENDICNKIYTIEKIEISLGNTVRNIVLNNKIVEISPLTNPGTLKLGDTVVGSSNIPLNYRKKIRIIKPNWLFYPDQKVKVEIPSLTKPGIYVPGKSLIKHGDNNYFVYVYEDGMVNLTPVRIEGFYADYFLISSPKIKQGTCIVLNLDEKNLELYDKKRVIVEKFSKPTSVLSRKNTLSQNNTIKKE